MKLKTILIPEEWHGKIKNIAKGLRLAIPDVMHCVYKDLVGDEMTDREQANTKEIKKAFAELKKNKRGK